MAPFFQVELDVDIWGFTHSPDGALAIDTATFNWTERYPTCEQLAVTWDRGESGDVPDFAAHNRLRDFVCSDNASEFLRSLPGVALSTTANCKFDGADRSVVQILTILGGVDSQRSLHSRSGHIVEVPVFAESVEVGDVGFFRLSGVPSTRLFCSRLAAHRYEAADLTGLRFVPTGFVEEGTPG
jgi:hypothetical protein